MDPAGGRTDGVVQLNYRGAASNPLVTGAPDIDGPAITVFRVGPVPGVGPVGDLSGDARRAIDEEVTF